MKTHTLFISQCIFGCLGLAPGKPIEYVHGISDHGLGLTQSASWLEIMVRLCQRCSYDYTDAVVAKLCTERDRPLVRLIGSLDI